MIDTIGHIIEKNDIKEIEKVERKSIEILLEDLKFNSVHCTLWGDYVITMQQHLDKEDEANPFFVI
ncbi:hypothetical protein HKD37_10G028377 [Glycine soja]